MDVAKVNFTCHKCGDVFKVKTSTKWYVVTCKCGAEYNIRPSKKDCGCKKKE